RILSYPDAHRYRLGANYEQIPVNRPVCPVHNYQRDGFMTVSGNQGSNPNYYPNSMDDIEADKNYKEPGMKLDSDYADYYDRNENDDDHYTQPGLLFRKVMNDEQRMNTINNYLSSMKGIDGPKRDEIIERQLAHFYKVDEELAMKIAEGLNFNFKT
ncbi:MAG: catalase, partial [Bacteroidota bacterium]